MKLRRLAALLLLPALFACASNETRDLGQQRVLVSEAASTVLRLKADPEFSGLKDYISRAKAVLIIPNMYRAGFVVGGEYGKAVLIVKTGEGNADMTPVATAPTQGIQTEDLQTGSKSGGQPETQMAAHDEPAAANAGSGTGWGNPLFYRLTAGSVGLQIGGQAAEVVITIMTDKGLNALLDHSVKLGGDLSVAMGPVGKNVAAASGMGMGADMYSFGSTAGLYGGISLTGAVLTENTDWNLMTYGASTDPREIMMHSDGPLAGVGALRSALNQ